MFGPEANAENLPGWKQLGLELGLGNVASDSQPLLLTILSSWRSGGGGGGGDSDGKARGRRVVFSLYTGLKFRIWREYGALIHVSPPLKAGGLAKVLAHPAASKLAKARTLNPSNPRKGFFIGSIDCV